MFWKNRQVLFLFTGAFVIVGVAVLIIVLSFNSSKETTKFADEDIIEVDNQEDEQKDIKEEEEDSLEPGTYQNPVFEPVLADPAVMKAEDGTYYAYGTEDAWERGQAAKVVPIVKSTDLVHWEYIGDAFTSKPRWISSNNFVWAPDVQFYNGKYHLYYTLAQWGDPNVGVGVAVSNSPEGPFEDVGKIFTAYEVGLGIIDPQLFIDDGVPYLVSGGLTDGLFIAKMKEDALSLDGEFIQLTREGVEAPYLIKRDNYYYLFGSPGSCCDGANSSYQVIVGRSESIEGPYVDANGKNLIDTFSSATILRGHILPEDGKQFVGPGHISIIQDEAGDDWMFYHAIDIANPTLTSNATRRPMMMDKMEWVDGWPTIKKRTPSVGVQKAPRT